MIRDLIFLLLTIIITAVAVAQNRHFEYRGNRKTLDKAKLIVVYNIRYSPDTTNIHNKIEYDSVLLIGSEISLFQCLNVIKRDEFLRSAENREEFLEMALVAPRTRFPSRFFKNYPPGKITTTDRIIGDQFIFQENQNICSWILHNELSNFKGYHIQKATCSFGGRDWIAWFSTEIPYSDGPHKFSGLPGLILKLYDTKDHYFFQMEYLEVSPSDQLIEMYKRRYIETTKSGFFRARESFRQSFLLGTDEFGLENHTRKAVRSNLMRSNNPIELTVD